MYKRLLEVTKLGKASGPEREGAQIVGLMVDSWLLWSRKWSPATLKEWARDSGRVSGTKSGTRDSVSQFSHSVMSDSLWPHGLQHARPLCPSPTPGVYSNLCPLSQWYHPTISSSFIPFSSHLLSFPAPGSFPVSQFFASGGQSIGVSASASVFPMNIQDWFPLGRTGWISLQSRDSQESSPTPQFKSINSLVLSFLYRPTLTSIHDYWKNHSFD